MFKELQRDRIRLLFHMCTLHLNIHGVLESPALLREYISPTLLTSTMQVQRLSQVLMQLQGHDGDWASV
jgi:hypothetical protein